MNSPCLCACLTLTEEHTLVAEKSPAGFAVANQRRFRSDNAGPNVARGSSYNSGAVRRAHRCANRFRTFPSDPSWWRPSFCYRLRSKRLAFPGRPAPPQLAQGESQASHSHHFQDGAMKNRRHDQPALPKFHRGLGLSPRPGRTSSASGGLRPPEGRRRGRRHGRIEAIPHRHRASH